jgi:hypothetical protein
VQLYATTPVTDWRIVCSESFGLQPRQLSTLCAIVAFWNVEGVPMPVTELQRVEQKPQDDDSYRVNAHIVSHLVRMALVVETGPKHKRSWKPTRMGLDRVRQ